MNRSLNRSCRTTGLSFAHLMAAATLTAMSSNRTNVDPGSPQPHEGLSDKMVDVPSNYIGKAHFQPDAPDILLVSSNHTFTHPLSKVRQTYDAALVLSNHEMPACATKKSYDGQNIGERHNMLGLRHGAVWREDNGRLGARENRVLGLH